MYKNLNYNINEFDYDDPYTENQWFNMACDETSNILNTFTNDDWNELFKEFPNKSSTWKNRLVDCMNNHNSSEQLKALLSLARTADDELFVHIVDNLIDFDLGDVEGTEYLYKRAEKVMEEAGDYDKRILSEFLEKKNKGMSR